MHDCSSLAAAAVTVQSTGLSVGVPSWKQLGMMIRGSTYYGDDTDCGVVDVDWKIA